MKCFSEETYAIFVDGELSPEEARSVRLHLSACALCRETVAALTAENNTLVAALGEAGASEVMAAAVPVRPAWVELVVLVAVLGLVGAIVHWVNVQSPSAAMNWLNPFTSEGRTNLAFNLMFYLSHQGGAVVEQLASLVGWLLLM